MEGEDEIVQREMRFDIGAGAIGDKPRRTPQGGLLVSAHIARTGVQAYRNPDGSTTLEYRPPEEVFHPDALSSFMHAPITIDHPGGLVSPATWGKVSVGHVAKMPEAKDDRFVATDLAVQRDDGVRGIERKTLEECSCGYTCRLDRTPGVTPSGEKYDAVQRDIRGNHIAIIPKGAGRAGPDVRMRLDSGESVSGGDEPAAYVPRTMGDENKDTKGGKGGQGGDTTAARTDATTAGELAVARAENERLKTQLAERDDANRESQETQRIDARVKARVSLLAVAAPIMGEKWTHEDKSDDAVRREVLGKLEPSVLELPEAKADAEDAEAFITGAFVAATKRADRATKALNETRRASPGANPGAQRKDAKRSDTRSESRSAAREDDAGDEERDVIADSRDAMIKKQKDAWKPPQKKDRSRGGK